MPRHADLHGCGLTKAACDGVRQQALGRCVSMTADQHTPTECRNWAITLIDGRGYCGVHASSVMETRDKALRAAVKKAKIKESIDAYIAWRVDHPSVHDPMPRGWTPA